MFTRLAAGLSLIGVLACVPAPIAVAPPPEPPVLEGSELPTVSPLLKWTLSGTAPADTLVRIHLDDACRGPGLRVVTAEQLREGVELELADGTINVFTATAIDMRGSVSECSAPVRMRYQRQDRPRRPTVSFSPELPTRETHFVLIGEALDAANVRLFAGYSCQGTVLATLSAEEFARVGFAVDLAPNTTQVFVLDAVNLAGDPSACGQAQILTSDQQPPFMQLSLRSPRPSPSRSAYLQVSTEAVLGWAFLGEGCTGPLLGACETIGCRAMQVEFPASPTAQWSAYADDFLGNRSACVNSTEDWWFDPGAEEPAVVLLPGFPLRALVPFSAAMVILYDGADCDPEHQRGQVSGRYLAEGFNPNLFFGAPDGGVISARGVDERALLPCGLPIRR